MNAPLTSKTFRSARHTTHYLEAGPEEGQLMVFLHGWPSIGLMWRAQMEAFAADGWHCVAPDLRGFGKSSVPEEMSEYTVENVVEDITELHDHLGGEPAIWVGHDWGSVIASSLSAHHPERSRGIVLTSLAYFPDMNALPTLVRLVDRGIYPIEEFPDGQWDYYRYYNTHFDAAVADLDADVAASLASIYQPGNPEAVGTVSATALVTRNGGRFGSAHRAPAEPADPNLWPPADFHTLVETFTRHGFRGPSAWYMNDAANIAYARSAPYCGRLSQPVLFVDGEWDVICSTTGNRQGDPMHAACADLTVSRLPAGHWLPVERKAEHVDVIQSWLRSKGL
ncbi:alpha/beta fold hydrolase [Curtobacterium sp. SL109]|uniref:alpha/beta fold hydrolase n=1 Tax=Curtobacterium sp. SL109 TaxID=2994662 RepID=UPI0022734828|nr:alpha/beta hydrolase [Curtobacterium sp. SL109]MCY1693724.1 alpha/beta hydrolase [Curtobacterium sp. SL109]